MLWTVISFRTVLLAVNAYLALTVNHQIVWHIFESRISGKEEVLHSFLEGAFPELTFLWFLDGSRREQLFGSQKWRFWWRGARTYIVTRLLRRQGRALEALGCWRERWTSTIFRVLYSSCGPWTIDVAFVAQRVCVNVSLILGMNAMTIGIYNISTSSVWNPDRIDNSWWRPPRQLTLGLLSVSSQP